MAESTRHSCCHGFHCQHGGSGHWVPLFCHAREQRLFCRVAGFRICGEQRRRFSNAGRRLSCGRPTIKFEAGVKVINLLDRKPRNGDEGGRSFGKVLARFRVASSTVECGEVLPGKANMKIHPTKHESNCLPWCTCLMHCKLVLSGVAHVVHWC